MKIPVLFLSMVLGWSLASAEEAVAPPNTTPATAPVADPVVAEGVASEPEKLQLKDKTFLEKIGTISGKTGLYHNQVWNVQEGNPSGYRDGHYSNAYLNLKFLTEEWEGLRLGVGTWLSHNLGDNDNNYSAGTIDTYGYGGIQNREELSELFAQYTLSKTTLTVGRQEIWRIVPCDNFDAVSLVSNEIKDVEIFMTYFTKESYIDHDTVYDDFTTYWGENDGTTDHSGVLGSEVTWTINPNWAVTGLAYEAETVDLYGGRVTFNEKAFNLPYNVIFDYQKTNGHDDDWNGGDDGEIIAINPNVTLGSVNLGVGMIQAADVSAGGLGSGVWFNDAYSPLDFGQQVLFDDASTYYVKATWDVNSKITLGTAYGHTDYGDTGNAPAQEINFSCTYRVTDSLQLKAFIASFDDDSTSPRVGDFNQAYLSLRYTF